MTGAAGSGRRVVVLTNPSAGGRHRGLLPAVQERLAAAGWPLQTVALAGAAEAEAACRALRADGALALVAVGGDGTLHAAVQGLAESDMPCAVVPAGSGNDFARGLGLPTDPLLAAEAAAAALTRGTVRAIDLARVTAGTATRWYATVLAAGFDAWVSARAERLAGLHGRLRYDAATLWELTRLRPWEYRLHLDGVPVARRAVLVAVGNTACYGGGIRICPRADPSDGLLDVVLGRAPLGRGALVRLRPRAVRGAHLAHPRVEYHRVRRIELDATPPPAARNGQARGDAPIVTYADGERCLPLPVQVSCVPGALRLLAA